MVIATKSTQPPVTLASVELSPTLRKPFQAPRDRGLSFGRLGWAACLGQIKKTAIDLRATWAAKSCQKLSSWPPGRNADAPPPAEMLEIVSCPPPSKNA
jgi:hypothetical protein